MMIDSGSLRILTPSGALPRAAPTDGMTQLSECWFGILSHEAAGNDDGDQLRRVRILRNESMQAYDLAVIGSSPYLITRVYHGTDDESGEPITDLTLMTGPRVFATVELIPEESGFDAERTEYKRPKSADAKATIAEVRSVAYDEYYTAQQAGAALSVRVSVYSAEYNDEPYVKYAGKTYPVRRKQLVGQRTDLVCGVT